jgi:pimeloyl-ACP methyl ester carboxylesterase
VSHPDPTAVPEPSPGPVALLLPGMSLNASIFPTLPMPTLAPDFNRFAPARGGMDPYLDVVDDLTRAPTWRRAPRRVVVAHSFGGMLALSWLLRHGEREPARIDGLVLIGTTAGPMFDAVQIRLAGVGGLEWRIGIGPFLPVWNTAGVTRGIKRLLTGGTLAPTEVDFQRLPRQGDLRVGIAGWRNTDWRARVAYRRAMEDFDLRDRLPEITTRTIVLHGTHDRLFPLAAARELAERLARAELRILGGAGHVLPLTHADAVRDAVRDVLAPHDAEPSAPPSFAARS